MTKSIGHGYTDTVISGVPSLTVGIPVVNYEEDYRPLSESPTESIITNVMSPIDQPSTFRFAVRQNKNIYAGMDINPSSQLPDRSGVDVLSQVREVYSFEDTLNPGVRLLFPGSAGMTVSLPNFVEFTPDMALALAMRCVAGLFEQGVVTSTGIAALQRGVLTKKAM